MTHPSPGKLYPGTHMEPTVKEDRWRWNELEKHKENRHGVEGVGEDCPEQNEMERGRCSQRNNGPKLVRPSLSAV